MTTLLAPVETFLAPAPRRAPVLAGRPWGLMVAAALPVTLLPLLRPATPGNFAPVDLAVVVLVVAACVGASRVPGGLRLPYAVPILTMAVGGALAALLNAPYLDPVLAVVQDLYVLIWCGALVTVAADPRVFRTILRAWVVSATVWALAADVGMLAGIRVLAGQDTTNGSRIQLQTGDPNLAGNYLVVSLFVLLATRWPRHRRYRWPMMLLILLAIAFSGSNGAVLGLAVGLGVALVLGLLRRHGLVPALGVAALAGILLVTVVPMIDFQAIQARAADSVTFLRDSVGRSDESSDSRSKLFHEGVKLWKNTGLIGIGPGQTKDTFRHRQAPYVKEAHDDYMATALERGVIGAAGLAMLAVGIATRLNRVLRSPTRTAHTVLVPRPEMLAAAVTACALAGMFYEVLHFRHVWALLAVVAALHLWGDECTSA
jgi:O-antigen ligase